MGILDNFDSIASDPKMAMAMSLLGSAGPSARPIGVGQALGAGFQDYQQAKAFNQKQKMLEMQKQMQELQMKEMQQKMVDAEALRNFDPSKFYLSPQQQAMSANGGPTVSAAESVGNYQPKFDQKGMIGAMMASNSPALKQQALQMLTKEDTPIALSDGGMLVTKDGRKLIENPKVPSLPAAIQEYQFAQQQGFKGTFQDFVVQQKQATAPVINNYPNPIPVVKPDGSTGMVQFGSKGAVVETPYKPEPKEAKSPTEAENKSGIYYKQMNAAEQTISKLEKEGMDMSRLWSQAETGVAGTLAGNMVASPRAQMARQAQNQWAEQMLRQQTGAAATEQEVQRTVKTYFPQPGDDKATVDLKRNMRANAMEAVGSAAGKAIKPIDMKSPEKDLPSAVQKFQTLPPAQEYKGRRMKGPDGVYRSNGMSWVKE